MSAPPDIRTQIRSLSIAKEKRPSTGASSPATPKKHLRIGWIIFAIAGLALIGIAYELRDKLESINLTASDKPSDLRFVKVTVRQPNELPPILTATGKIVSDHQVKVFTKVSGQITELFFEQGDIVREGQILARIETINYRALRDQAAAMLSKSNASLEYQRVNFDRMKRLHESQNAPDIEWADAKRALEEAEAEVRANQAALDFAQKALNDCEVVTPIAGVILERNVEVGDFVAAEGGRGAQANAQFCTIADMKTLRVEIDVSELEIHRIRKDLPCTVIPDAYKDRKYKGYVMWIDPGANYSKATVQVKVRVEQPDPFLRVEGSAQVVFLPEAALTPDESTTPSIWIPASACILDSDAQTGRVFIAKEGRIRQATVSIGKKSGSEIEIVTGLSNGDSVAVDGLDKLRDGQRLRS